MTETYFINTFLTSIRNNKTLVKVLYGTVPIYTHLTIFGCLFYAFVTKLHTHKFDPRCVSCVFLGYPFTKKGYKVYNLLAKTSFISKDVIFLEHIFPFHATYSEPSSLFPLCSIPHYSSVPYNISPFFEDPPISIPNVDHSHSPDAAPIIPFVPSPIPNGTCSIIPL